MVWCGVVWCGVVWCGVVWCGVVWCGVVRCGVVWCGVVWCGAVWYQPFSKLPFSPRQTLLKWWVFFPTCFRRSSDASSNTQAAPCLSWKGWSWKRLFSPSLSTSPRCYLSLARFFFSFFWHVFFLRHRGCHQTATSYHHTATTTSIKLNHHTTHHHTTHHHTTRHHTTPHNLTITATEATGVYAGKQRGHSHQ